MKIEVRPAKQEEMEEFRRVANTSLVISPDIMPPEAIHMISPEMTLCAFIDGRLATSYAVYPLNMRFNGTSIPVAGVTFVGTLPIYRCKGCLTRVVSKHFELLHERGEQPIAALYASRASIYHRYGYGIPHRSMPTRLNRVTWVLLKIILSTDRAYFGSAATMNSKRSRGFIGSLLRIGQGIYIEAVPRGRLVFSGAFQRGAC